MEILEILIFPSIIFWIFLSFFYEWFDRKIVARLQKRVGPYFAGKSGFLQPFADFIKLLSKEDLTPKSADFLFTIASVLALFVPLFSLSFISFFQPFLSFEGDVLVLFYLFIFQTLLLQIIGFSSYSRFGVVGSGRLILQGLAFAISLILAGITPIILTGSFNLLQISKSGWFIFSAPIAFIVFFFSFLGELQLLPFDIPIAKQEIVAGWETELSGKKLAFVKLGKSLEFLFSCCLIVSLFLGGGNFFEFLIKVTIIVFLFSVLRSIFARLRIDQTLEIVWKILIPLALLQLFLITIL
jgi:NADH-quinone oxidoreductase subunit H